MTGRELHRMQVIVPERRRRRRYVTLKNAGIAGIAVVFAFLLLSAWSAFRPHSAASRHLFSRDGQVSDSASTRHEPIVVNEGSTYDHPGTDSSLLDADAQDQLRAAVSQAPSTTAVVAQTNFEHPASQLGKGRRITISGGSEGIQVHSESMPATASSAQTSSGTAAPTQPPL